MKFRVIIDTPCYFHEILDRGLAIARDYDTKYKYIDCKVNEYSTIEKRISTTRDRLISQIVTSDKDL